MIEKISIEHFAARVAERKHHLVSRASFEARSITVATSVPGKVWASASVFASKIRSEAAEKNLQTLSRHFSNLYPTELNTSEPLEVANSLHGVIDEFAKRATSADAIIDVMRHRALIIGSWRMSPPKIWENGCQAKSPESGLSSDILARHAHLDRRSLSF
jgi:hypothetical protein